MNKHCQINKHLSFGWNMKEILIGFQTNNYEINSTHIKTMTFGLIHWYIEVRIDNSEIEDYYYG